MTETEFPWGTVTRETGQTHVDVSVDTEDDVSVSTKVVSDATDEANEIDPTRMPKSRRSPGAHNLYARLRCSGRRNTHRRQRRRDSVDISVDRLDGGRIRYQR